MFSPFEEPKHLERAPVTSAPNRTAGVAGATTAAIRLVVADDHFVARQGLVRLCTTRSELVVVGEAGDGVEALALVTAVRPDVAVIDITMPRMDGIELARRITQVQPTTRVLTVSARLDAAYVQDALTAGAMGYVPKTAAPPEIIAAILAVAGGKMYLHPSLSAAVLASIYSASRPDTKAAPNLSEGQCKVLRLAATGFTHKEIAARLGCSVKTVDNYKTSAMKKLSISTRVQLVRYGVEKGWLREEG